MEKSRLKELQDQVDLLINKDKETSDRIDKEETLKEQDEKMIEIAVPKKSSTIYKYKAKDLPLYFKWEGQTIKWCYRVYNVEGKIKVDQIKVSNWGGFKEGKKPVDVQYGESTIDSAFHSDNTKADKVYWDRMLQDVIDHLQND
tara:strand:- start:1058 stop:1489 length:432 start_codon:yes stop_codon:yes gene_type:complete